jgi:predicted deacetylase
MRRSEAPRRLIASIHDVTPRFADQIDLLFGRLERLLGAPRFAMLVVPDHWDCSPLAASPAFRAKLRSWADRDVEMFLHGWNHRDDQVHRAWLSAWKARRMTAGEGEFLGLGRTEAARRLVEGRKVIEDIIGRPVSGFVAPAWLYGPGTMAALEDLDFPIAEDHFRVWRPADGTILARGPVVTWASRSAARRCTSLAFAAVARHALAASPILRIAVHPGDAAYAVLLESIDRTFSAFMRSHVPARYADLVRN